MGIAAGGVDTVVIPAPATVDPRLGPTGVAMGVFLGCVGGGARGVDTCCGMARGGANPPPPRGCVGGGRPAPDGPLGGVDGNPLVEADDVDVARCCNLSGWMAGPLGGGGCGDIPFLGPLGGERGLACGVGAGERGPEGGCAGDPWPREFTPDPEKAGESGNRLAGPRGELCLESMPLAGGERERGLEGGSCGDGLIASRIGGDASLRLEFGDGLRWGVGWTGGLLDQERPRAGGRGGSAATAGGVMERCLGLGGAIFGVRTRGGYGERGLAGEWAQRSPPPLRKSPPPPLVNPPRNGGDLDLRPVKGLGDLERRLCIGDLGDGERFLGDLARGVGLDGLLGFSAERGGGGLRSLDRALFGKDGGDLSLLSGVGAAETGGDLSLERGRRIGGGDISLGLSGRSTGDLSLIVSVLAVVGAVVGAVGGAATGGAGGGSAAGAVVTGGGATCGAGGWGRDGGGTLGGGGERSLGLFGSGASFLPCCSGGGGDLSFLCGGGDLSFLIIAGDGVLLLNLWSLGEREPARGGGLLLLRGGGDRDLERLLGGSGDLDLPGLSLPSLNGAPEAREIDLLLRIGGGGERDRGLTGGGGDLEKRRLVGT